MISSSERENVKKVLPQSLENKQLQHALHGYSWVSDSICPLRFATSANEILLPNRQENFLRKSFLSFNCYPVSRYYRVTWKSAVSRVSGRSETHRGGTGWLLKPDLGQKRSRCYLTCGSDTEEAIKALQLLKASAWKMPFPALPQHCRYSRASSVSHERCGGSDAVLAWWGGTGQYLPSHQGSPAPASPGLTWFVTGWRKRNTDACRVACKSCFSEIQTIKLATNHRGMNRLDLFCTFWLEPEKCSSCFYLT